VIRRALFSALPAAALLVACSHPFAPVLTPSSTIDASCRSGPEEPDRSTGVRWRRPADARERARLDAWCAAVGPVLFREAAPAAAALDDVLFVSWNVHVGSADLDRLLVDLRAGRLSDGRRRTHLVLLLQEAVRGDEVPSALPQGALAAGWIGPAEGDPVDVERLARRQGLAVFYAPSMRNGTVVDLRPPTDRGNAILSTVALSDPLAIELPGPGQRRVAIAARVEFTADGRRVPMSVGAAHLATMGPARSLWLFGAAPLRDRQAKWLSGALPSGFMVLGADLNSWMGGPGEPAARELRHAFPATPAGAREPTFAAGLVLDHMFFRLPPGWRARLVRAPERYGSDHYPLVGWVEAASPQPERAN
jgi:endonuclease/exonuclease/phosphatase family metal-dependent hydrolase